MVMGTHAPWLGILVSHLKIPRVSRVHGFEKSSPVRICFAHVRPFDCSPGRPLTVRRLVFTRLIDACTILASNYYWSVCGRMDVSRCGPKAPLAGLGISALTGVRQRSCPIQRCPQQDDALASGCRGQLPDRPRGLLGVARGGPRRFCCAFGLPPRPDFSEGPPSAHFRDSSRHQ